MKCPDCLSIPELMNDIMDEYHNEKAEEHINNICVCDGDCTCGNGLKFGRYVKIDGVIPVIEDLLKEAEAYHLARPLRKGFPIDAKGAAEKVREYRRRLKDELGYGS